MKITFTNNQQLEFFSTLRSRVDAYFKENNISKSGNGLMYLKTIIFLSGFFSLFFLILFGNFNGPVTLLLASVLGLVTAFIGFNVSHDAIHGSYSNNATLNKLLGYTFDMVGASSYMWNIMHNVIHHTYTNIPEHDDDIEPVFLIRLNPEKKVLWIHRFQHLYASFFYCLTTLNWVLLKDYKKLFVSEIASLPHKTPPPKDLTIVFLSKISYYIFFIVVPLIVLPFAWWQIVLGFLWMHAVCGFTLAIVFQLAHVVKETEFPIPNADGTIENSWAIHQLHTTADFARKSPLATFFFGGLNYQVEHHLFPKICHVHYKKISPIVEKTAKEFGIPFHDNKTMWQAIKSHYALLRDFGRPIPVVA